MTSYIRIVYKGNAQSVGASIYGTQGRYSRPKPKKPSKDAQAMLDLGPVNINKMRKDINIFTFTIIYIIYNI